MDIFGTSGGDTINGTTGSDIISALGGADTINSSSGDDSVDGGNGNDRIVVNSLSLGVFQGLVADDYTMTANLLTNGDSTLHTTFVNVERIYIDDLRAGNSTVDLTSFAGSAWVHLGDGDHVYLGAGGSDSVWVGLGSSTIDLGNAPSFGSGIVFVASSADSPVVFGGVGATLVGATFVNGSYQGGTYTAGTLEISYLNNGESELTTVRNGIAWINSGNGGGLFADATNAPLTYNRGTITNAQGTTVTYTPIGVALVDSMFDDALIGSRYDDILSSAADGGPTVNAGTDYVTGNGGADSYDYEQAIQNARFDHLLDFDSNDRLSLSHWDTTNGVLPTFIGTAAFSGVERQIRYYNADGKTYVQIDMNGDGTADQTLTIDSGEYQLYGNDDFASGSNATLRIVNPQNMVTGTASGEALNGTEGADVLRGYDGSDEINGGGGNDLIVGGSGADTMSGGFGNDTYIVDDGGDLVIEFGGQGNDSVLASVSYVLPGEVERLTLTGTSNIGGSGNGLNNVIWGNVGNNTLNGLGGVDRLYGDAGDDTLVISNPVQAGEVFDGGAGTDTLVLELGAGSTAPSFFGTITRANLIPASLASLERLQFASINTQGIAVNITTAQLANSGITHVVGGGGYDQLSIIALNGGTFTIPTLTYSNWNGTSVNGGGDSVVLVGNGNFDYVLNAAVNHDGTQSLFGGLGNDTLNGTDGMEFLDGGAGVNILNGGGGDDGFGLVNLILVNGTVGNLTYLGNVLNGGDGHDLVSVGGFVHFEGTWSSIEEIYFRAPFNGQGVVATTPESELEIDAGELATLPTNLLLSGTGVLSVDVEGGSYDASGWVHASGSNVWVQFFGNDADNVLIGTSGNDRFSGGFGHDTYTGGAGTDVFEAGDGQHVVLDFTVGEDRVDLEDMNFTSFEQLLPYLSQVGSDVVFSRLYGGVAQTMTLLNVSLASLTADSFLFQTAEVGDEGDVRNGTDQADELFGANGNDVLNGLGGNDILVAGSGDDVLRGGQGDDRLYGGDGNDLLSESSGDNGPFGDDLYDGGAGSDRVSFFRTFGPGVTVDLNIATAQNTGQGMDTLISIENVTGAYGDNSIVGTDADNWFWTFWGTDHLTGGGGNDYFTVGSGDKFADGGSGTDTIELADTAFQPLYNPAVGLTVSLALQGVAQWTNVGNWTITNFENLGGWNGNDHLTGDDNANIIAGHLGNDTLIGGGGDDILAGDGTFVFENGAQVFVPINTVDGPGGNDTLEGGLGNDTLYGGGGNDTLRGGQGDDLVFGGDGNDFIAESSGDNGPFGNDLYDGGAGSDRVSYFRTYGPGVTVDLNITTAQNTGQGMDTLISIENVTGAYGDNTIVGNDSDNWFWTFWGTDHLTGGGGNDYFTVGSGDKFADGGSGTDTIELADTAFQPLYNPAVGLTVSLALQGVAQWTNVGNWTISNFENLGGWNGNDHLTGDDNANVIAGHLGDDTLIGGGGNDTLAGDGTFSFENGAQVFVPINTADGPGGNDTLEGGAGNDTLIGGGGNDILRGGLGDDLVYGGDGNDVLSESSGANGPFGNDLYDGGAGIDRVNYYLDFGPGVTVDLNITTAQDTGRGMDTLIGIEQISGAFGNNTLIGNEADNFFQTHWGTDHLTGNGGNDYFTVGSGDKFADGGTGTDTIEFADFAYQPLYNPAVGLTVSLLLQGSAQWTNVGNWTISNFENLGGWTGNDNLTGDGNANIIAGHIGNDTINGGGGDDILAGDGTFILENGVQTLLAINSADGPGGDDILQGAGGNDTLIGGGGNDTLRGGIGNDLVYGGDGNDLLAESVGAGGPFGDDLYDGGTGSDRVSYFADSLAGVTVDLRIGTAQATGRGTDTLVGVEHITADYGNDVLIGNDATNWFWTFGGNDTLSGMGGNDYFTVGQGTKVVDGGEGEDVLEIDDTANQPAYSAAGITISLALQGQAQSTVLGAFTLTNIENLSGNYGTDHLTGDSGANKLAGFTGSDVLVGGAGDDTLAGDGTFGIGDDGSLVFETWSEWATGAGNDQLFGGLGNDTLIGGGGNDLLDGGEGADQAVFTLPGGLSGTLSIETVGDEQRVMLTSGETTSLVATVYTADGVLHVRGEGAAAALGTDSVVRVESLVFQSASNSVSLAIDTGVVVDGQVAGALVFRDANGNGQLDQGEAVTTTGANGAFSFATPGTGAYVAVGGTNVDTGLPNLVTLRAPEGSSVVNPLTTLVAAVMASSTETLTAEQAAAQVSASLGLSAGIDLLNTDVFAVAAEGNADALAAQRAASIIVSIIVAADDAAESSDAPAQVLAGLAELVIAAPAEGVSLTSEATITQVLSAALTDAQVQAVTASVTAGAQAIANAESVSQISNAQSEALTTGNDLANTLHGGAGDDTLNGFGGNDQLLGNGGHDMLIGGTGSDTMTGGSGNDTFVGTAAELNGDTIADFSGGDRIIISDVDMATFAFSVSGNTLTYSGGSITFGANPTGFLFAQVAAAGGVQLTVIENDVSNDFNGDGRSDILWRDDGGRVTNWLAQSNGSFASNFANADASAGLDWQIAGTGDFNKDGRDDILWRNVNTGALTDWLGQSGGGFASNFGNAYYEIATSWHVEGIGDFNGDGRDDILWRDSSGRVTDWLGQGPGGFTGNFANADSNAGLDWQIAGVGDFNNDGRDDVLWRNVVTGELTDWLGQANGGFVSNFDTAYYVIDTSWNVIGTGDFNNDGRDDILWRNDNGRVTNWLGQGNGGFTGNFANADANAGLDWHVQGIGDYNRDGHDDVLWRNDSGDLFDWLGTAGGGFASNMDASNAFVSNSWHIQAPDLDWL